MGLLNYPNEPPLEVGSNCALCFSAGETPKYLYMLVKGIQANPSNPPSYPVPPNGLWRIEQVIACGWSYVPADYSLSYQTESSRSYVNVEAGFYVPCFYAEVSSPCIFGVFENYYQSTSDDYYGGTVEVFEKTPPLLMTWEQNFVPFDDANNELWDLGSADYMQRVVRAVDNTNIIAKIVTENS